MFRIFLLNFRAFQNRMQYISKKFQLLFLRRLSNSSPLTSLNPHIKTQLTPEKVLNIVISRTSRKNAFDWPMFQEVARILNEASDDSAVKICTLSGEGDYFTSGVDLAGFEEVPRLSDLELEQFAQEKSNIIADMFDAFIFHRKMICILANGPGVGLGATVLGLSDVVLATESAFFLTPFMSLGMNPEGCSSITFPAIMGRINASKFLLLAERIPAQEALRMGIVTEVLKDKEFGAESEKKVKFWASSFHESNIHQNKSFIVDEQIQKQLSKRNHFECLTLGENFKTKWFRDNIAKMLAKK